MIRPKPKAKTLIDIGPNRPFLQSLKFGLCWVTRLKASRYSSTDKDSLVNLSANESTAVNQAKDKMTPTVIHLNYNRNTVHIFVYRNLIKLKNWQCILIVFEYKMAVYLY